jgi:O-antigen/teichoic acid export membrane protein
MKGNEQVGLYSAATKAIEVLNVLPVMIMSTVLPVMTRYWSVENLREKSEKLRALLRNTLSILTLIAWPILVGLWVTSYQVIATIATPEFLSNKFLAFTGSDAALKILAWSLFFSFINNLFIYLLITVGQQRRLLWINGSTVVGNIILNLILIPRWGFIAASYVTVLSEALVLALSCYYGWRTVRFAPDISRLMKIILSGIAMGAVLAFLQEPIILTLGNKGILALIALGGCVYLAGLLFSKAFTLRDLKSILKKDPSPPSLHAGKE